MQISDLTGTETGRHAHLTVNGKTYSGAIKHIRSHQFPGTDSRLAGNGTPPPDRWTVDIHLDTVAFDGLSPDTEIEVLDRLPSYIPATTVHFPEHAFEQMVQSTLREIAHGSMGAMRVKLDDGREGTYELSTNPQQQGWLLARD